MGSPSTTLLPRARRDTGHTIEIDSERLPSAARKTVKSGTEKIGFSHVPSQRCLSCQRGHSACAPARFCLRNHGALEYLADNLAVGTVLLRGSVR